MRCGCGADAVGDRLNREKVYLRDQVSGSATDVNLPQGTPCGRFTSFVRCGCGADGWYAEPDIVEIDFNRDRLKVYLRDQVSGWWIDKPATRHALWQVYIFVRCGCGADAEHGMDSFDRGDRLLTGTG